jgi:peptide/nickel transport system substrate-binding protein
MRAAAIVCVGVLMVAACSKGGGPAAPGVVRFDLASDPTTLNPLFEHPDSASIEQQLARLSFEPFVDLTPSGKAVPALLSEIPSRQNGGVSAGGRTIVFHLRRGVRWSDGVPVTSADVLFTLHAIMDPRNPVRSRDGYALIDRAVARGPHIVIVHLKHPWAPAVTTLFSVGSSTQFVLPEHVLAKEAPLAEAPFDAAPAVGDGPYRFVSWTHGERLVYRANPLYWRGKPRARELDIRIAPDPSTNLVLLESRALDWNLIAPAQYAAVSKDPRLRFVTVPTAVVAALVMNTSHPPLDDVRVRRAIAMSIDRGAISRKITLGKYPVTNVMQPQFSWAYDPAVREPGFDPAAAGAAFDAAGWRRGPGGIRRKNGKPLRLVYVQFPESTTGTLVAADVQAALRARGVEVTIKSVSNAQLFLPKNGMLASGAFDLAYVPFTMGADPDDSWVLRCGASANYMRWCSRRVDGLEARALASTSEPERKALYGRIGRIVAQEVPLLYLFNADYIYAYDRRLKGFDPNPFLPTWNAWQWRT